MLEQRKCPNCGAPVPAGRYVCEYCGSIFKKDIMPDAPLIIEYARPDIHTIEADVIIPDYAFFTRDAQAVQEYTLDQMKRQIADALTAFIEIKFADDPVHEQRKFRGRVRVLDPTFRF